MLAFKDPEGRLLVSIVNAHKYGYRGRKRTDKLLLKLNKMLTGDIKNNHRYLIDKKRR